jgi:hypothetical protein
MPAPAAPLRKSGCLSLAANLFAWGCVAAFILLVGLALPVLNASSRLLDAGLYKQSLRDQDVYNRFPELFAAQMLLSQAELGREAQIDFRGFTAEDWKLIASELVTPQWLQSQVESLIDQTFAAAEPGAPAPALSISLADVKARLSGDSGFNIYKKVIQTKRECSLDNLFSIIDWVEDVPGAILPVCNIPPLLTDIAAFFMDYTDGDAMIRDVIKDLPGELPDELALSEFFSLPMAQAGRSLAAARLAAGACLVLAGLCLLLVFISPFGRTLTGWLLLWGAALAGAGLACLAAVLLLPASLGALIAGAFSGELSPSLEVVVLRMAQDVTGASASALGIQAALLLFFGAGLATIGVLVALVRRFRG